MSSQPRTTSQAAQVSLDGYIRMTFEVFSRLNFIRKLSWEDHNLIENLIPEGIQASCAGYCEWATSGTHHVSIGWAWFALPDGRQFMAPGGISSNVMLVTQNRYDLGMERTSELLSTWLSTEQWQSQQHHSISELVRPPLS
ncbi:MULTISPECIES: DUF4902 domain-containing protein [unclassified Rhodanobacter]|uniref:DUF4902 domain-containing protein n=1 Tax=unclassified Rhodanobacter TaxID=2621553 RepID=UPI0016164166|nr:MULTISPECIES: DUF4902 domain-containing protein [unclassified Rhodanobacter]MBB6241118.1 hypothetical protein [Rhodanobacter sp. MP1X3]MBB6248753.1 hypothetical protein [Rhodanobacter sp. A1T4]